mmetsp:Transcript_42574/g.113973  ORF Transcript_42574/g.113973 Transcript_42574/m.113973 type:complete len:269 (+) Transcript_42574:223-1029(+)
MRISTASGSPASSVSLLQERSRSVSAPAPPKPPVRARASQTRPHPRSRIPVPSSDSVRSVWFLNSPSDRCVKPSSWQLKSCALSNLISPSAVLACSMIPAPVIDRCPSAASPRSRVRITLLASIARTSARQPSSPILFPRRQTSLSPWCVPSASASAVAPPDPMSLNSSSSRSNLKSLARKLASNVAPPSPIRFHERLRYEISAPGTSSSERAMAWQSGSSSRRWNMPRLEPFSSIVVRMSPVSAVVVMASRSVLTGSTPKSLHAFLY